MPFPPIHACVLCEEMREERRRLTTLLGFYGVMPHVEMLMQNFNMPMPRIAFVFLCGLGEGHYQVSLRLLNSQGGVVVNSPALPLDIKPERRPNIVFQLMGLSLPAPDIYRVVLVADDQPQYETTFEVRKGQPADFA